MWKDKPRRLHYSSKGKEFRELAIDVPKIELDVSFFIKAAVRVVCSSLLNCRIVFSIFNPRFTSETNQPYFQPVLFIGISITVNC